MTAPPHAWEEEGTAGALLLSLLNVPAFSCGGSRGSAVAETSDPF
jgi:hypothetical protein